MHPGESPASYVCEGLMEYLLEDTPEAKALRDHIVFKFGKLLSLLNPLKSCSVVSKQCTQVVLF